MLQGNKTLVGSGRVRDVFLVEYEEKMMAIKTLRGTGDLKSQRMALDRHNREVRTLSAVSERPRPISLGLADSNNI